MNQQNKKPLHINEKWLGIIIFICVAAVFFSITKQGTQGPLMIDSIKIKALVYDVDERGLDAIIKPLPFGGDTSGSHILTGRQLSVATLAANIYFAEELSPSQLKWTNVIIHLFTSLIVFLLSNQLWRCFAPPGHARWLATAVALLWLFAPVNVTTVFYSIQRMGMLSSLFVLLGLYSYVLARQSTRPRQQAIWLMVFIASLCAGVLSKENGVILIPLTVLTEAFVWRFRGWPLKPVYWFSIFTIAAITISIFIFALFPQYLNFSGRSFDMVERLWTQSRALVSYMREIILPLQPDAGLFHDGYPISRGWLTPVSTLISTLAIMLLIIGGAILSFKRNIIGFGILFFFVGHLIESTFLPLENYFIHRNYLPSLGLFIAITAIAYKLSSPTSRQWIALSLAIYVGFFAIVSNGKSSTWSSQESILTQALHYHPQSSRATTGTAQLLVDRGRLDDALALLDISLKKHSPETQLRTRLQKLFIVCLTGRPIEEKLYQDLRDSNIHGITIEIGQALSNISMLYTNHRCDILDVDKFIITLDHIDTRYQLAGIDNWALDYYSNQILYLSGQKERSYQRLHTLLQAGEWRAGLYLIELYKHDGNNDRVEQLTKQLQKDYPQQVDSLL